MFRAVAALIFVLAQVPSNSEQQQPRKGSIEGIVLKSASGDPLDRARLTLTRVLPPQQGPITTPPPQIPPVQTDRNGKFIFKDLDPGQYRLNAQRNGYASQQYGQRTPTTPGTVINLTEGQQLKDVAFRLIPAATISGRVRDSVGEAVAGTIVSLMRTVYNVNGYRSLSTVGTANTDDRGEYRIFWVPSGRYILSVGASSSTFVTSIDGNIQTILRTGGTGAFADRVFPPTYYPGTLDVSRAAVIDLQPGAEMSAVDFVLTQPTTFRIRGRVVDSATGKPPQNAGVSVVPRQETTTGIVTSAPNTASVNYNNATGTFEARNVIPGNYWLRATSSSDLNEPINMNVAGTARTAMELLDSVLMNNSRYAQIPVEVGGSDIEGAVLTLGASLSIPMRLQFEEQDVSTVANLDRIRVNLRPTTPGTPSNAYQAISFNAAGTAVLGAVSPGEYRVQVSLPSPDYYLKEAIFERTDVLNRPWEITNQTEGTLTLILSNKGGLIEGTLTDIQTQPVRGSQVVLIPDQVRDRTELYKTATTDQNGRFTLRGVPPGGYRIYGWEVIEANAWFDRDVLAQYENQGKPIRILEAAKENVELRMISAPK
jgi:hypothetical protein